MEIYLALLEKYQKERNKLPLVIPMVVYHGTKPFNAPRSLWELFYDPELAKEFMGSEYKLTDWQAMPDTEIKKKATAALAYFMKYVHSKNMLSIWEEFLELFKDAVLIDQKREYIYMTSLLWYTGNKVSKDE
ncbi:transposase, YhgA-like family protein [Orientia chuto str. Dubai]|uniref:Transposase, YhgA-like family protein n=1 Tax=Orientia chuto str. Dubai TaxID=1359168 RepID=A0A0F3MJF0_9RICK|nr:Rpn family recombination-promoting nuclease/putative transposase [Candidatus Orientia mediorientalis]KJV55577.1 transposase, YhgA-like family protein [Orientia chuto str. Dubai]